MDKKDIAEQAYKNGYEAGAKKFAEKLKEIKIRFDLAGNPYSKKYTQADIKEVAEGMHNQYLRCIDEICKEIIGEHHD